MSNCNLKDINRKVNTLDTIKNTCLLSPLLFQLENEKVLKDNSHF